MIRVEFKKPVPPDDFDDWLERCERAAKRLKGSDDVSEKLYKEQRQVFLDLFNGKCAYCEAKIILDQHKGDVEHYRPKGGVTDENDNDILIDDGNGGRRPHPGYYWLAYDWRNLLPSCVACNRPGKTGDRRVGKWNRFPVVGNHAWTPDGIASEQPLLLNPLLEEDDPDKHLVFDPETGRIIGKTDRGKATVAILDLNRDGLYEERRSVYGSVLLRLGASVSTALDENAQKTHDQHMQFLMQHKLGRAAYAMAGRLALERYKRVVREQMKELLDE